MLQRLDCLHRHYFPLPIDFLVPVITKGVINPFFHPICSLCRDLIPMFHLSPPSFFLCLSYSIFPPSCLPSHTQKTHAQNSNYNTAKSILEQQASHSVVEGGWKACSHQTSKLQHVKPGPVACPVQHWHHSSAMWVDQIVWGNLTFCNHKYLDSYSKFWWPRHAGLAISVHHTRLYFSLKHGSRHFTNTKPK